MNKEKELERHNKVMEQIENATCKKDLPNISYNSIAPCLVSNLYFNKKKLTIQDFKEMADAIIGYGYLAAADVVNIYVKIIRKNYPEVYESQILAKFKQLFDTKKIDNILEEVNARNIKLHEIISKENLDKHLEVMKQINLCFDIKELPKVGMGDLNQKILSIVNNALGNGKYYNKLKVSDIKDITDAYYRNATPEEIEKEISNLCDIVECSLHNQLILTDIIIYSLNEQQDVISYIIDEIRAKENRKAFIYKNDHDFVMDSIESARRISQLPPNISFSTLTSYLAGNATIYPNDNSIKSEYLKKLAELLLNGYKWESKEVEAEILTITDKVYPDKKDAFNLLYSKFSKLPRTYYIVEEINFYLEKEKEFISTCSNNVNVYFIPNGKSPIEGGKFYNCYINRVGNLNLEEILPLDLNEIVPPTMDIDSVEWYVQENYDPTFKVAGGIILKQDETIGNVNIFKPNDGKVGVTLEEKQKMDKISDLDLQIQAKEAELSAIDAEVKNKEEQSMTTENALKQIVSEYEQKVLALQMEMLESIKAIKSGLGMVQEENQDNASQEDAVVRKRENKNI